MCPIKPETERQPCVLGRPETGYANYEDFDLDGPAQKAEYEQIKDALADGLLKAMGLPGLNSQYIDGGACSICGGYFYGSSVCPQCEQETPHVQNQPRENKEE